MQMFKHTDVLLQVMRGIVMLQSCQRHVSKSLGMTIQVPLFTWRFEQTKIGGFPQSWHGDTPIYGCFIMDNPKLNWMIWGYPHVPKYLLLSFPKYILIYFMDGGIPKYMFWKLDDLGVSLILGNFQSCFRPQLHMTCCCIEVVPGEQAQPGEFVEHWFVNSNLS